jgi:hypothetical protein
MVDPAPEGDDREVILTVVAGEPAPKPVAVGAEGSDEDPPEDDDAPAAADPAPDAPTE